MNRMMLLVIGIVATIQMLWWYPLLPDPMPTHFNVQRQVDGMTAKKWFCVFQAALLGIFLIAFPLLPFLLRRLPDSFVKIPNRVYWLAPDRRSQTFQYIGELMTAIGWITVDFLITQFQLTAQVATRMRLSIMPEFFYSTIIYGILISAIVIFVYWHFRLPTDK